jgi:hypothetical protein
MDRSTLLKRITTLIDAYNNQENYDAVADHLTWALRWVTNVIRHDHYGPHDCEVHAFYHLCSAAAIMPTGYLRLQLWAYLNRDLMPAFSGGDWNFPGY